MGFFSRFRKEKAPANSLSTSQKIFWGGTTTSGAIVTEQTAMQTSAVFACVRVLSEAVASLPLHIYRYENDGSRVLHDHYLTRLLHKAPNPEMSSFIFRETMMSHLLIYGNAYAQIIRDGGGKPLAIYPLQAHKMDVNRGDNGKIYYTYWRDRDEFRSHNKSDSIIFRCDEILHIPGLSFDGLVGISPIAYNRNSIGLSLSAEEYGASFFSNNASPGGVLEHPGTLENQEAIRNTWESLYGGSTRHHRVAVLEEGMKFHPITIPPDQAQFLETRKFQLNDIARIFRVPPHMIGDLEKSSFSNIEQQSLDFVRNTLNPWVVRWEQQMDNSLILPSEQDRVFIKFNVDGLLRGDYETRMKGYAVGFKNGFI